MTDALYHALGVCGEHWHPNALNMTALFLVVTYIYRRRNAIH